MAATQNTHTLAEVDEGGQGLEPGLGVVGPDQQPLQGQAALHHEVHPLVLLHLQLGHTKTHTHTLYFQPFAMKYREAG